MGEMHGFRMGCKQLTHQFEWVHRTAEQGYEVFQMANMSGGTAFSPV